MLRPIRINQYLNAMQRRGYSAEAVLAGSGLEAQRLSDPACLVDAFQCQTVIANMLALTDNDALGFEIAGQLRSADFGIFGHAIMSSPTLRDAHRIAMSFFDLVGGLMRFTPLPAERDTGWAVALNAVVPLGDIAHFCAEETLKTFMDISAELVQVDVVLDRVQLAYPAPAHAEMYRQFFDCPVAFSAAYSAIWVASPPLDTLIPSRDEEVHRLYHRHCMQVMRQIAGDDPMAPRLRAMFLRDTQATPTLSQAAAELGMSIRTLERRLHKEGHSYQRLLNQFRFDLASEYLKHDRLSTKEIAAQLGYKDTNAFRRAFSAWSGSTIKRYRHSLKDT